MRYKEAAKSVTYVVELKSHPCEWRATRYKFIRHPKPVGYSDRLLILPTQHRQNSSICYNIFVWELPIQISHGFLHHLSGVIVYTYRYSLRDA